MKRRREILIELTPLLDVILIMIFILLTRAGAQTTEAREKTAEEAAKASALAEEVKEAEGREKEEKRTHERGKEYQQSCQPDKESCQTSIHQFRHQDGRFYLYHPRTTS